MPTHLRTLTVTLLLLQAAATASAQGRAVLPPVPTPTDVKPGSITCDECPYPYPSRYLDISVYDQDVRIAYMDVAPQGTPNGHTVLLLHGNNFGGFYFKAIIDGLTKEGFRVIVPDQIGYGRSSKPIAPYNFNSQARNTWRILQHEKIEKAMVIGHSMGGMLAARFATQFPKSSGADRDLQPDRPDRRTLRSADDADRRVVSADAEDRLPEHARRPQPLRRAQSRSAWNQEFETYTRIRYSWTLSADWPRLAMVQALIGQMLYADPVVYDWAHIQVPTLAFGGAEDMLLGPAKNFQERMALPGQERSPTATAKLLLIPGLGHVPHLEAPEKVMPPLVAFLKEGLTAK